jgi:hypothetical protein
VRKDCRDSIRKGLGRAAMWISAALLITGCTAGPLAGLLYSHVRYPLTSGLHATLMPIRVPNQSTKIEISVPLSKIDLYAQLNSNAIGEIAKAYGIKKLYFADQEKTSILGIWTAHKVILYGE